MITVKLFAILKDKAGRNELTVAFTGRTVGELLKQVAGEYPVLGDVLSCGGILISVNQEFVKPDALVKDGDEVALMPPFSGGEEAAGNVRIQQEPFSLEQEVEALKRSSASIGAIVAFLGTTRDLSKGKQVAKLEFEHYPGMAGKKGAGC